MYIDKLATEENELGTNNNIYIAHYRKVSDKILTFSFQV